MSLPRYFTHVPPFPSDVPVHDLAQISLRDLENDSKTASKHVFDACRHDGFFLLDLKSSPLGQNILSNAEALYDLTDATLTLPQTDLDEFTYNPKVSLIGYKRSGTLKTDDGGYDTTELYTVGQDDMLGTTPARSNPQPIEDARPACASFLTHAHAIASTIFGALESQLGLAPTTLTDLCTINKPSQSALRLLLTKPDPTASLHADTNTTSNPPQPTSPRRITLGQHTDIGLLTLLFNGAGGLQMLPPGYPNTDANWKYIRPQPGCALVNLGDTIVEWTGGVLRSGLHRVVTAPGGQRGVTRRSFGYFLRPGTEARMRSLRVEGRGEVEVGGDESEMMVDVWAARRAGQIIRGEIVARSWGGVVS